MRVIARNTLVEFWNGHPEARVALERWFEVAGGNYRLVVAFDFRRQVAFVKFIGTHAEYDRIDALTVSQY
jgi:mRNA interferase HigB